MPEEEPFSYRTRQSCIAPKNYDADSAEFIIERTLKDVSDPQEFVKKFVIAIDDKLSTRNSEAAKTILIASYFDEAIKILGTTSNRGLALVKYRGLLEQSS